MKKTEKTALTAALFAAAMHVGTANSEPIDASAAFSGNTTTTVVGMENKQSSQPAVLKNVITEFKSEMAGVYGPPPTTTVTNAEEEDVVTTMTTTMAVVYGPPSIFTTAPDDEEDVPVTTTTEEPILPGFTTVYGPPSIFTTAPDDEEDTPVTTTTEPILPGFTTVYGPPSMFTTTTPENKDDVVTTTTIDKVIAELENDGQPVYGPKPFYGDVNNDGSTDIYDMILLREEFAKPNPEYSFQADVNGDFKVSVADLVLLNKYLLGQIDDIRDPNKEEDVVTTLKQEIEDVYGPPSWFTTTVSHEEDVISTTQTTFKPLYGPPSVFE